MIPKKLRPGDHITVIAPSRSLAILSAENRALALERLNGLGFNVSFGKHVEEIDLFSSSSIESRISDFHDAFLDKSVSAILTVIGGFNSNQLLRHIDYSIVAENPKIFCGFSDITALTNAMYAKTGLVSYSGPHFASFGMLKGFEYSLEYFKKCLLQEESFTLESSDTWSDDEWYLNQEKREFIPSNGYISLQEGVSEGTVIGGNLCTMNLLQGTEFMPSLDNKILFIEDDFESHPATFDRDLQSLIHQPGFSGVRGIVIGIFQKSSRMSIDKLSQIISTKSELAKLPIIANVNFGHTYPQITFPIGGHVRIKSAQNDTRIEVITH